MAVVAVTLPEFGRVQPTSLVRLSERLGMRQLWDMKVVRYTTMLSMVFFFSYGPLEAALPIYSDAVLQTDARWLRVALVRLSNWRNHGYIEQRGAQQANALGASLAIDCAAMGLEPITNGIYQ